MAIKRLFLAIDPPFAFKSELFSYITGPSFRNKQNDFDIRFIPLENYHITISFLGTLQEKNIGLLCKTLLKICKTFSSFPVYFSHLQFGPHGKSPSMLWGVFQTDRRFISFYHEINVVIKDFFLKTHSFVGFHPRNIFVPHITLGRLKELKTNVYFEKDEMTGKEFTCKDLVLFESYISQRGAAYTKIASFSLS